MTPHSAIHDESLFSYKCWGGEGRGAEALLPAYPSTCFAHPVVVSSIILLSCGNLRSLIEVYTLAMNP